MRTTTEIQYGVLYDSGDAIPVGTEEQARHYGDSAKHADTLIVRREVTFSEWTPVDECGCRMDIRCPVHSRIRARELRTSAAAIEMRRAGVTR